MYPFIVKFGACQLLDKSVRLKCSSDLLAYSKTLINPIAVKKAKIVCSFGLFECSRVKMTFWSF